MKLVIAEKPSVAQAIAQAIGSTTKNKNYYEGNGYIVTYCYGHLVALANPEEYDEKYKYWNYSSLPFAPETFKLKVKSDTSSQFKVVKDLMQRSDVTELVCATDSDREGECIFRYIYTVANCHKPFKRLWISSMENSAIQKGFESLKDSANYDTLFQAGYSRAKADQLVGLNFTRLYSVLFCNKGEKVYSIGRVQTPTLAMVVKRDYDVTHFVKSKFYKIVVDCGSFSAKSENFESLSDVEKLNSKVNNTDFTVIDVKSEVKTVPPPKLYDITSLQRDCNKLFGYTAQQTLDTVQGLYEPPKRLLTYPRTDSQYITDDMQDSTRNIIECIYNKFEYIKKVDEPNIARITNNKKAVAHHAIIPTKEIANYDLSTLTTVEKNVLFTVAKRLVIATSTPHKYRSVVALLKSSNANDIFKATGKSIISLGWKFYEQKDDKEEQALPELSQGQVFSSCPTEITEHWTSPPSQFTEDTLLKAMEVAGNKDYDENSDVEKKGLGTSATRAVIIENLITKEYLKREKKKLLPTEKGITLINKIPEEIKSPLMTVQWEQKLKEIEKGNYSEDLFISEINRFIDEIIKRYSDEAEQRENERKLAYIEQKNVSYGKCPNCGQNVVSGKYGIYCKGKCGIGFRVYGRDLKDNEVKKLLTGEKVSYTSNGKKTVVLPQVEERAFNGKTYIQFVTEKVAKSKWKG